MKKQFSAYLLTTGRLTESELKSLSQMEFGSREPVGRLALLHGLLGPNDIDRVLSQQQNSHGDLFGHIAVQLGLLTESQLRLLLAGQAVRSCLELVEDLILAGVMDLSSGLGAIAEFVCREEFTDISAPLPSASA